MNKINKAKQRIEVGQEAVNFLGRYYPVPKGYKLTKIILSVTASKDPIKNKKQRRKQNGRNK